ncbi:SPASM domain-containing protein [Anaerosporobacter sp.]|uniref:SPASM domain-containing protein n=1 Tax=Anaerosporobacter sp. TaxID=1872529 RepID=UPI00286F5AB5|nr:SPASM domain-containing protein [Anaerosporobacter sp.]
MLGEEESAIINELISNPIEVVCETFSYTIVEKIIQYLLTNAMGNIYEGDVYNEPYLPYMPFDLRGYIENPCVINQLALEIQSKDKMEIEPYYLLFQGCNSSLPSQSKISDYDSSQDIKNALKDIIEIHIEEISFRVNNIDKTIEEIKNIMSVYSNGWKPQMEVITGAFEIAEKNLDYIEENNINLVISIIETDILDFNKRNDIYDCLDIMEQKGINYALNIILLSDGELECEVLKGIFSKHRPYKISFTEIIENKNIKIRSQFHDERRIENVSMETFFFRGNMNTCLNGKLAIDCMGNIKPCIYSRKILGHIKDGIRKILEDNLQERYWRYSKNKMPVCGTCENRFACADCYLVEEMLETEPKAIKIVCDYDIHTGQWKKDREEEYEYC